eukprot:5163228-Prymnesium_polylepis.2
MSAERVVGASPAPWRSRLAMSSFKLTCLLPFIRRPLCRYSCTLRSSPRPASRSVLTALPLSGALPSPSARSGARAPRGEKGLRSVTGRARCRDVRHAVGLVRGLANGGCIAIANLHEGRNGGVRNAPARRRGEAAAPCALQLGERGAELVRGAGRSATAAARAACTPTAARVDGARPHRPSPGRGSAPPPSTIAPRRLAALSRLLAPRAACAPHRRAPRRVAARATCNPRGTPSTPSRGRPAAQSPTRASRRGAAAAPPTRPGVRLPPASDRASPSPRSSTARPPPPRRSQARGSPRPSQQPARTPLRAPRARAS